MYLGETGHTGVKWDTTDQEAKECSGQQAVSTDQQSFKLDFMVGGKKKSTSEWLKRVREH